MPQEFFRMGYYNTYYVANMIHNILRDQFSFLRNLDEFYGDDKYLAFAQPFSKVSALHSFIDFCLHSSIHDDLAETDVARAANEGRFWLNAMLDYYAIKHTGLAEWMAEKQIHGSELSEDDLSEYARDLELEGPLEELRDQVVHEVFFLTFLNRDLLLTFNEMMARQFQDRSIDEVPEGARGFFAADGVLRRKRIPRWVQKAVLHRDRGSCVLCGRDLSGLLKIDSPQHYDHIVPLKKGGLNDVSNIQLLCLRCNTSKQGGDAITSDRQEKWF